MRKNTKLITGSILALALAAAGTTAAFAGHGPHGHGAMAGPLSELGDGPGFGGFNRGGGFLGLLGRLEFIADEIGLTDEQRDAVRTTVEAAIADARPVMAALRDNRETLREAGNPESYDVDAVASLAAEQGALMAELIVLKTATRAEVRSVLTAEQIETLEALREERGGRRFGRRHH